MKFTKYEEFGDYHWKEFEEKTIYGMYARLVSTWVQEETVLDMGAGDGLITHLIGAIGIDNDPTAVMLARKHNVQIVLGDARALPYNDESFDAVFIGDVIEHIKRPRKVLQEAHRVLRTNGHLYITSPPKKEDLHDPFHYREYSPIELRELVEKHGFLQLESRIRYERILAKFKKESIPPKGIVRILHTFLGRS